MRRLAVPLALLALATGCGGDDENGGGRSVSADAGGAVTVAAHEYRFDPDRLVVAGPGTLTIRLRNEGDLAHNIRVLRDGDEIGGTQSFPPGRTESARVQLEAGSYELICSVGDHAELGMKGTLEVR